MSDKLILRRRPALDIAIEDFDVWFGGTDVGRIHQSADVDVWHWRLKVTLAGVMVDQRGHATSREKATAQFREKWDQLKLAGRLGTRPPG